MNIIIDIHTHHAPPQPRGVVSIDPGTPLSSLMVGQAYSVGIHPWDTVGPIAPEAWNALEELASDPRIVAIGECGVDLSGRGGFLFRQIQVLKRQIELSEELGKPLILHDVKAHDVIVGLRADIKPTQPWVVHGLRNKPEVAEMLMRSGCMLSLGAQFNPDTLKIIPSDRLLAETDAADTGIEDVVRTLSEVAGRDLTGELERNAAMFLGHDADELDKILNNK